MKDTISVALVKERHDIPEAVDGYIFESIPNPMDIKSIESIAYEWGHKTETANIKLARVYVTGLSTALVAVIKSANYYGINLLLMHYDRDTGGYVEQWVGY